MFFYSLCSSSKGNASFLGDSSGGILFDAGIGIRNFAKALAQADMDPSCIRAVFISHDHSDHVMGLEAISTRFPGNFGIPPPKRDYFRPPEALRLGRPRGSGRVLHHPLCHPP
mgnify:CR=1 FL=1